MSIHCGEDHGKHAARLDEHEKGIKSLWDAHDRLQVVVTGVLIKVASIVGAATALQVIIMVYLQIHYKG